MGPFDIILMGVSGSGKSTVGFALAEALGRAFVEGDDHHPSRNRAKMSAGNPLTNADRDGWVSALCEAVNAGPPAVIACSALNAQVRAWLEARLDRPAKLIHLSAPKSVIARRLAERRGHFFDPSLLASQYAALERDPRIPEVSVDQDPAAVLRAVRAALEDER